MSSYNMYSMYCNQNLMIIDEYEQFINELKDFKNIRNLIIEKFPDLQENNPQTINFKNTNKKVVCSRKEQTVKIISYQNDVEIDNLMITFKEL